MSSPPTMGIGTSSSSGGGHEPPARNAYAVNRDASELGRSRAQEPSGLSSAWPDACHLYVRGHRNTPARSLTSATLVRKSERARTSPWGAPKLPDSPSIRMDV